LDDDSFLDIFRSDDWIIRFDPSDCDEDCEESKESWEIFASFITASGKIKPAHVLEQNVEKVLEYMHFENVEEQTIVLFKEKEMYLFLPEYDIDLLYEFVESGYKFAPTLDYSFPAMPKQKPIRESTLTEEEKKEVEKETMKKIENTFYFNKEEDFLNAANDEEKDYLVLFYSNYCGSCQKLKPVWGELKDTFDGKNVIVSAVDCNENKDLCDTFKIESYPSIYLFRNGWFFQHPTTWSSDVNHYLSWVSGSSFKQKEGEHLQTFLNPEKEEL